jgi:hypothetical protein
MVSDQVNNVFLIFNDQNGFRLDITSLSPFYNRERMASMGIGILPTPVRDCVAIPILSLRATEGSVAISEISIPCEIASVVSLPRNDIAR